MQNKQRSVYFDRTAVNDLQKSTANEGETLSIKSCLLFVEMLEFQLQLSLTKEPKSSDNLSIPNRFTIYIKLLSNHILIMVIFSMIKPTCPFTKSWNGVV